MTIVEISERARIIELLGHDPIALIEPLDECERGVDGLVTVFAQDVERPPNLLIVRWGQKHLGLGSIAHLVARRLSELGELIDAFPADRGRFELTFPFWTSPAISSGLKTNALSISARYQVDKRSLGSSPNLKKAVRVTDHRIIKPMFPKLAEDAPAYVLAMGEQLVSVAAVTHAREDVASIGVYTTEAARGRGFGRAVLLALAEELLALSIRPTIGVDLGNEAALRMTEGAGFHQHSAALRTTVAGRIGADGLVTLGG